MPSQKMITDDTVTGQKTLTLEAYPNTHLASFSDYVICAFIMPVSSAALK